MPKGRVEMTTTLTANTQRIEPGDVRAVFHRTLAGWAHDVLRLRSEGLDRPTARISFRLSQPRCRKAA